MNRAGKVKVEREREMDIFPSSRGWRSTSSALFLKWGSSSRKSTPLWEREISPGTGNRVAFKRSCEKI